MWHNMSAGLRSSKPSRRPGDLIGSPRSMVTPRHLDRRLLVTVAAALAAVGLLRPVLAAAAQRASLQLRGARLTESSQILQLIDRSALIAIVVLGALGLSVLGGSLARTSVRMSRWVGPAMTWAPVRTRDAVWAFAGTSVAVLLVQGWSFIPGLGNDATVYHSEVWRDLDGARSLVDLVRPQSGLPGLVMIYGTLGRLIGREPTALLLTVAGLTATLVGTWIVLREVGVSHRVAGLLVPLSLVLSYGAKKSRFDYSICSSACSFVPSPRFLAISAVLLAIALLLAGRSISATLVTIIAASVHALDGFVPMILLLVAGSVVLSRRGQGPDAHRVRRDQTLLLLTALVLLLFVRNYSWIPFQQGGAPDIASIIVLTPALVVLLVLGVRLLDPSQAEGGVTPRHLSRMLGALAPFGLLFAVMRSPSGGSGAGGFLESVVLFETLIEQLRRPQAVLLSVQQAGTATMLVVLVAFTLAVLLPAGMERSERHRVNARWLAITALASFAFAVVGGLLNEYTTTPFVTSLYPFRQLWLLALGALAAIALVIDRLLPRTATFPGVLPGVTALLFLLWADIELGNAAIGLAAAAMLIIVWKAQVARRLRVPPAVIPALRDLRSATRGGVPLTLLVASVVMVVGPASAASVPTVTLEASAERIAREGGELDRDVIASAALARELVEGGAVVLVPVRPSNWTAFELLSGHPVAFDYNVFRGTSDAYERFRRMCDPKYRFDPDEDLSAVGVQDIVSCMADQGPDEIRAVAASLGATHGVVPTAQWDGSGVLGATASGGFVLVRFEDAD